MTGRKGKVNETVVLGAVWSAIVDGPGALTVLTEAQPASIVGDAIIPHETGPHLAAHMVTGSTTVLIEGIPACREGDLASCGDVMFNGALTVVVGD